MYPKTEDSSLRIFSPIILFHDTNSNCSDNKTIQLKKQKVTAMLQTNGVFWSSVIQSTRSPQGDNVVEEYDEDEEDEDDDKREGSTITSSSSSSEDDAIMLDSHNNNNMNNDNNDEKKPKLVRLKSSNGRKRRGNLPKIVTAILKQWLVDHSRHPYPTEDEKRALKQKTNLTLNQISNWFINARRRILPVILSSPPGENQSYSKGRKRLTNEMDKHVKQLRSKGRRQDL
ncbi:hypothetical protein K501DRAFT_268486 [Backusella circina FSU 941]|nr:hypothetical protein K501DRAFT_268486 [Backusella circina FSU 941]